MNKRRVKILLPRIDKSPRSAYIHFMEYLSARQWPEEGWDAALPLYLLKRSGPVCGADPGVEEDARDDTEEVRGRLLCKMCGTPVTSEAECIAVNGSHDHICRNPGGLVFHVGCFSGAAGCLAVGMFTEEYTWFPGYAWCYGICSGCQAHLGWRYEAGGEGFFGLILDRLARG